ncbi:MAG: hypothetical protein QNK37_38395 [Acidobacteriota bacterium]|nr:hypothetical protein [Acidobacteriota bacterium]
MTIKFGKDGKITIEPTPGNVKAIAELVLQQFEERLASRQRKNPDWSPEKQRKFARRDLIKNADELTNQVIEICRQALKARPEHHRHDLLGRLLMRPIEPHMSDDADDTEKLPRQLIKPVLAAVRTIMGEVSYSNLNEFSVKPSLEFCVVHDLERAVIDWDEFYNQNLVNILLIRLRNALKRWAADQEDVPEAFTRLVNNKREADNRSLFVPAHWHLLKQDWEIPET